MTISTTRQVRASTDPEERHRYRFGSSAREVQIPRTVLFDPRPLGAPPYYTQSPIVSEYKTVGLEGFEWRGYTDRPGSHKSIGTDPASSSTSVRSDDSDASNARVLKYRMVRRRKRVASTERTEGGEKSGVKDDRCSFPTAAVESEPNRLTVIMDQLGIMSETREMMSQTEPLRNHEKSKQANIDDFENISSASSSPSIQRDNEEIESGGNKVSDAHSPDRVAIDQQQGSDQPSPSTSLAKEPHLVDLLADVASLLDVVKQWSKRANNSSVLESILDRIDDIFTGISCSPTQLGEQDLPDGHSNRSFFQNGQHYSSESSSSNCYGLDARASLLRNGNLNQNQPTVRMSNKSAGISAKLLRCPYFFRDEEQPCQTLHKYIRDLTRHLKCHGFYFCSKCCEHFTDLYGLQGHQCGNQVCIDLDCRNRLGTVQVHRRQQGCKPRFDDLDTPAKWYSLYSLQFPGFKRPIWDEVYVAACSNGVTASSNDCTVPFPPLTTTSSSEQSDLEGGAYSAPRMRDTSANNERESLALDRNAVDDVALRISQQLEALRNMFASQNERLDELNERSRNQETLIHDLRNEVVILRNNMLPFGNNLIDASGGELMGGHLYIDSTNQNAQWR